ncbi:MAG: rhomboid family intramembrane serine protease [Pseudomonadota bacterium]
MIVALEVSRDIDLALFSRYLQQSGVEHRIAEDGDRQVVWVTNEAEANLVRELFDRIDQGQVRLEAKAGGAPARVRGVPLLHQLWRAPLTALVILLNLAFFPVTFGLDEGEVTQLLTRMTFVGFELDGAYLKFESLAEVFAQGEYWRLLSPMLLHFGVMHIVFNLLWVWEVGRRIEIINGAATLLLILLVTSLSANFTQYFMTGPSLFGGMSGVVFGLLGYGLVWSRLVPSRSLALPDGIYIFMVAFLVIGFSGVLDALLPGSLANGAHLGGFLAGLGLGAVAGLIERNA